MKNYNYFLLPLFIFLMLSLQSCEAIGDIFQAGMWMGVTIVVIVILVIIWLFNKMRRR